MQSSDQTARNYCTNLLGASLLGVLGVSQRDQRDAVGLAGSTLDQCTLVGGRREAHVRLTVDVQSVAFQRQPDTALMVVLSLRGGDGLQQRALPVQADRGRSVSGDDRPRRLARCASPSDDWLGQYGRRTGVAERRRRVRGGLERRGGPDADKRLDDEFVRDAWLQAGHSRCTAVRWDRLMSSDLFVPTAAAALLHLRHTHTRSHADTYLPALIAYLNHTFTVHPIYVCDFCCFYRATLCVRPVFAVVRCPSVRPSVRLSVTLVYCSQMA